MIRNLANQTLELDYRVTETNYIEEEYLKANPDVAVAVSKQQIESGHQHFLSFGKMEGRRARRSDFDRQIALFRKRKLDRLRPNIDRNLPHIERNGKYDFLTTELREASNIADTENVSAHGYDQHGIALINQSSEGLVLDVGCGRRPVYYDNVVNYEIVDYDSTDVIGVGEHLPFKDNSFRAVISVAVLEHVRDPFACAAEIARVLKPGGQLFCVVPFLQPYHGYPHHYYNMTGQGLRNLFEPYLKIDKQLVLDSTKPIWTLTWMVSSWAQGLSEPTKEHFLDMPVRNFLKTPRELLNEKFVTELSDEKNFELACATALFASK